MPMCLSRGTLGPICSRSLCNFIWNTDEGKTFAKPGAWMTLRCKTSRSWHPFYSIDFFILLAHRKDRCRGGNAVFGSPRSQPGIIVSSNMFLSVMWVTTAIIPTKRPVSKTDRHLRKTSHSQRHAQNVHRCSSHLGPKNT